jgi:hypothetical protein
MVHFKGHHIVRETCKPLPYDGQNYTRAKEVKKSSQPHGHTLSEHAEAKGGLGSRKNSNLRSTYDNVEMKVMKNCPRKRCGKSKSNTGATQGCVIPAT